MTPSDRTPSTFRDFLRQQTRGEHERVDALYGTCNLALEQDYKRFLSAQAVAWATLRPVLDEASTDRLDAILCDLDALALDPPVPLDETGLPARDSLGMRYVLEGSRLGSTVLLRDLEAGAPELAQRAGSYLKISARADEWKRLSVDLQACAPDEAGASAILADTRFTFGLFERSWRAAGTRER